VSSAQAAPRRGALAPLYAAGFVTAFGAHAVAANLGRYGAGHHTSLLELGVLLAVYDGAEVVLKPVFGSVSDRIGPRLVLLGGLIGFAFASAGFVIAGKPAWLGIARLAQGASAAAFSPAAAALVAGLGGTKRRGRSFGGYGSFKGLGYLAGPVVGGALVVAGGYPLLFVVLAALAAGVALVCFWQVPVVAPVARSRETLVGLVRRLGRAEFAWPVVALAAVTGALSAGIGFLPVAGARAGLGALVTGVVVSVMAAAVILVQPRAGQAFDDGRLSVGTGLSWGIGLCGIGLVLAAVFPGVAPLTSAAALIGLGVGVATPLGFAALAAAAPEGRMGQTMGAAEVGRELGDAGGPLVVGGLALFSLTAGLAGLGVLCGAIAVLLTRISTPASTQPEVAN
jgi:MFS family permease